MNINEYISSGVLESYVLGELSAEARAEVERNLERYPALKTELTEIEQTQEQLLLGLGIKPREEVKKALLEKIEPKIPAGKQVQLPSQSPLTFWKLAVAASVTIAIIAVYMAYDYRSRWMRTASDLSQMMTQNQRIAEDYNTVNKRIDQLENDVQVMENPDFKRVVMRGTENAPTAMAYVYWNENSREVYLRIQDMKSLSSENQYQLWAIIDGKPVDAGVFDAPSSGLLKMKNVGDGAATFAVTVEPKGGSPTPSLQMLQVAGNVDKG